ncbi:MULTISPECIES: hypothetical protein [Actinosynnema]|uniref:hypothetical protein n=1 Tax=Actinosynnema TaxID=40566 RepID=UPI0020A52EA9|nr:hypothetical protein [Actinosynnema pretiosum]
MLRGEWRGLPPIQRVLPEHPLANPVDSFTGGLTSWRSPAFLAPLGHFVAESEPSGVIGEPPREGVVFSRPGGIPTGTGSAVGASGGGVATGGRGAGAVGAAGAVGSGAGFTVSRAVEASPATEGLAGDGFTGGGFAESVAATGGTAAGEIAAGGAVSTGTTAGVAAAGAAGAGGAVVQRSIAVETAGAKPVIATPEPITRTLGVDEPRPVDVEAPAPSPLPTAVEPVAQALPLAPQTSNAVQEAAVQRVAEPTAVPMTRQFIAPPPPPPPPASRVVADGAARGAVRPGLGEPLVQRTTEPEVVQRPVEAPVMPGFPEAGSAPSEASVSGQPSNGLPMADSPIGDEPISDEPAGGGTIGGEPISAGLVGDEPLTGDVVQRVVAPDAVAPAPATVSRSVELPVVPAAAAPTTVVGKSAARTLGLGQPRTIQTYTTPTTPTTSTAAAPGTSTTPGASSAHSQSARSVPTTPVLPLPTVPQGVAGGERPVSLTEMVQRSLAADQPAARAVELPAELPAELPVAPSTPSVPSGTSAPVQRFEQAPVLSLAPGLPQRFVQRQAENAVPATQPTWSVQRELAAPSAPAPGPRVPTSIAGLASAAADAGPLAALGGGIGSVGPSGWSLDPQIAQSLGVSLGDDQPQPRFQPQPGLAVQGYTAPQQGSPAQQALSAQRAFPTQQGFTPAQQGFAPAQQGFAPAQQGFAVRPGIGVPQSFPVQSAFPVQSGLAVQLSPAAQSASPAQPAFPTESALPAQPGFPQPSGSAAQSVLPAPSISPTPQPLPLAPAFPAPPPGPTAHPHHFAVQRELYDPPPGEPPVPPQAAPPPTPDDPPPGHPEAPADPAAPAPTTSASTTSAPPAAPIPEPEELLKKLYDPLLRRLKAELWLDRERRGSLTDRLH